jgi:hypothetical protein
MEEILKQETRFETNIDKVFAVSYIVVACIDYCKSTMPYMYFSFIVFMYMLYNLAIAFDLNDNVERLGYSRVNREIIAKYTKLRRLDKRVKKCFVSFVILVIGLLTNSPFEIHKAGNLARLVLNLVAACVMYW